MANLVVRYVVRDIKDQGNTTSVVLSPANAADNPNGTENNSLWPAQADAEPFSQNHVQLQFKAGAGNPFVKNGQVVATFAAG